MPPKKNNPPIQGAVHRCTLPNCNGVFATRTALTQHVLRSHTHRHRFSCPHCDYTTSQKPNLAIHHRTLHVGGRYQCPHCPSRFSHAHNHVRHVRDVHNDPTYTLNGLQPDILPTDAPPSLPIAAVPDAPAVGVASSSANVPVILGVEVAGPSTNVPVVPAVGVAGPSDTAPPILPAADAPASIPAAAPTSVPAVDPLVAAINAPPPPPFVPDIDDILGDVRFLFEDDYQGVDPLIHPPFPFEDDVAPLLLAPRAYPYRFGATLEADPPLFTSNWRTEIEREDFNGHLEALARASLSGADAVFGVDPADLLNRPEDDDDDDDDLYGDD